MSEARGVFDRLRDVPEPPLTPAVDVLAAVRQSSRRRTAVRLGSTVAAVLAIIGGIAVVGPRPGPTPQHAAGPAPTETSNEATPSGRAAVAPAVPTAGQAQAHSAALTAALLAAIPPGFAGEPVTFVDPGGLRNTIQVTLQRGSYRSVTLVQVRDASGIGMLGVVVGDDLAGPAADPCAADRDLGIEGAQIESCTLQQIGGIPIRLVTAVDAGQGEVISATRYLQGGYILVFESQAPRVCRTTLTGGVDGSGTDWWVAVNPKNLPALRAMPFEPARLAAVAVDVSLLA